MSWFIGYGSCVGFKNVFFTSAEEPALVDLKGGETSSGAAWHSGGGLDSTARQRVGLHLSWFTY